ncbi:MAG TPA: cytochrome o ubiquinol oxidase subunit III [Candidatus Paceibacterota bacterium]|nr:cytochrome o ubiquinol oxidase subunit III [Candidatus Paceibacterota bacterium]
MNIREEHMEERERASIASVGFWVYIMSDCLLFGSLFATFAVLEGNTFAGPALGKHFSLPFVLVETMLLLTSSVTAGFGLLAARRGARRHVLAWLFATFLLGAAFVALEIAEFRTLVLEGYGPSTSAALSSFFTLVGTHGLHVATGLLWMAVLMIYVVARGITGGALRRLTLFTLFWHFLDIVWIFIFTIVYLFNFI